MFNCGCERQSMKGVADLTGKKGLFGVGEGAGVGGGGD